MIKRRSNPFLRELSRKTEFDILNFKLESIYSFELNIGKDTRYYRKISGKWETSRTGVSWGRCKGPINTILDKLLKEKYKSWVQE